MPLAIASLALGLLFLLAVAASFLGGAPWSFPWSRGQRGPARAADGDELTKAWMKADTREALQTRAGLLRYELGAAALPVVARRILLADVVLVASVNLLGPRVRMPQSMGTHVYVPSPFWEPGPDGLAMRRMCWVPAGFVRWMLRPGAQRLRGEPAARALVADLYVHYRQRPIDLLAECCEARSIFLEPPNPQEPLPDPERTEGRPHRLSTGVPFQPHHGALSTLMADVARRLIAGNTVEEIRAVHGLRDAPALRRRAWKRLNAFREVEDGWFDDPTAQGHDNAEQEEQELLASLGDRTRGAKPPRGGG